MYPGLEWGPGILGSCFSFAINNLHDLIKVIDPLWASVPSFIKWEAQTRWFLKSFPILIIKAPHSTVILKDKILIILWSITQWFWNKNALTDIYPHPWHGNLFCNYVKNIFLRWCSRNVVKKKKVVKIKYNTLSILEYI